MNNPLPPERIGVPPRQRLQSLDAYRGLIMISLAFVGFGLAETAANHIERGDSEDRGFWEGVHYQFSHAEWVGCSYWDLIQPSFMFMVGVSMPFSYGRREERGESQLAMLGHAARRSVLLIGLSILLMSKGQSQTSWEFMNVLAQIGLGYTFAFLLWNRSLIAQLMTILAILAGTWAAYTFYPTDGIDLQHGAPEVGVSREWASEHLRDIRPSWHKNANVGHAIDIGVLNLFPRQQPFRYNRGGYQTFNFVPSIATMLIGLICGRLLCTGRPPLQICGTIAVGGFLTLVVGVLLANTGWCPMVKRIWTPSWTLYSGGLCCLILALLYFLIDVLEMRRWSFPLIVVGMNSIVMYCLSMTLKPFTARQLETHFGDNVFTLWGQSSPLYAPTVQAVLVGLVFWTICWLLYRNRMFVRM